MPSAQVILPEPWDSYLQRIDLACAAFWQNRPNRNLIRLQNVEVWQRLRAWIATVIAVPGATPVTPFEILILYAAACLYEVGWQTSEVAHLTREELYAKGGQVIRTSFVHSRGGTGLDISWLDPTSAEVIARVCEATGRMDILALNTTPEAAGYQEVVRLRYIVALFQLADLLCINRVNKVYAKCLQSFGGEDWSGARLSLSPYLSLTDFRDRRLIAYFRFHPEDARWEKKAVALFYEPLRKWLAANQRWLHKQFNYCLALSEPQVEVVYSGVAPHPFAEVCPALPGYLQGFDPSESIVEEVEHTPAVVPSCNGESQQETRIVTEITHLVQNDRLREAIELLPSAGVSGNDAALLLWRLKTTNDAKRRGTMQSQELQAEFSRIAEAILESLPK